MVKDEIIAAVAADTGYHKTAVSKILESTLTEITKALSEGKRVTFAGFGSFQTVKRAARMARNPKTNEPIPIPERFVPIFTPGSHLKALATKETEVENEK